MFRRDFFALKPVFPTRGTICHGPQDDTTDFQSRVTQTDLKIHFQFTRLISLIRKLTVRHGKFLLLLFSHFSMSMWIFEFELMYWTDLFNRAFIQSPFTKRPLRCYQLTQHTLRLGERLLPVEVHLNGDRPNGSGGITNVLASLDDMCKESGVAVRAASRRFSELPPRIFVSNILIFAYINYVDFCMSCCNVLPCYFIIPFNPGTFSSTNETPPFKWHVPQYGFLVKHANNSATKITL